jgi:hypothetical protein
MMEPSNEALGRMIYSIERAQGLLDEILRMLEERGAATLTRAIMPALLTLTGELELLHEHRVNLAGGAPDDSALSRMSAHATQIGEGLGSLYQEILADSHADPI